MNPFVQRMTDARQMALDGVGSIRMTLNDSQDDFESCNHGWHDGQALCAYLLDEFVDITNAKIIEVIPYRRPAKNRLKIESTSAFATLKVDGERTVLYVATLRVADHWIYKGYKYVQIEVIK